MARDFRPRTQTGAALVIALIFLVAMTVLGVASMGGNQLQQRMAYSATQSNLAFQSTESGIAAGEDWIDQQTLRPVPDCAQPCSTSSQVWQLPLVTLANLRDSNWWTNNGREFGFNYTAAGRVEIPNQVIPHVAQVPRYVIEEVGEDEGGSRRVARGVEPSIWYYRVTARGSAIQVNPTTLTQTVYARQF